MTFVISLSGLFAQEAPPPKQSVIDIEKLEVRDSAGRLLKKDEWLQLNASGKYNLTFNPDYTQARITKLSAEGYVEKMKSTPKPGESKSFVTQRKSSCVEFLVCWVSSLPHGNSRIE
jgi:hypothetical protein